MLDRPDPTPEQMRFLQAQQLMLAAPPLHWRSTVQSRVPTAGDSNKSKKTKRGRHKTERATLASSTKAAKKQAKPAHLAQKKQRQELIEQVRVMESHQERLKQRVGLPTAADKQLLANQKTQNAVLDEHVHTKRRCMEQLRSMVRQELQWPVVNPLATYIHLPRDQAQRREILRGMRFVKLRRAAEIGIARFRHLDATQSYMSEERFTSEDGVYHCNRWEMAALPQFKSARQIYDALLFWIYNMEISVTEMTDQVTVREDNDDDIEPTIWNHRMVSTEAAIGCTEELNIVGFAYFYEHHELLDGAPLGIIICDSVDVDDLLPYKPLERTRKEVQNYLLLCEELDPRTQRKAIVLKACTLNAQIPAQFPLDPKVVETIHQNMSRWLIMMNQFLSSFAVAL